jgi:hypothetical protein
VADADVLAVYTRAQELIFSSDADLSAYRIRYVNVPYVVVLGQTPPVEIGQQVDALLAVVPSSVVYRREAGGWLPMLVCGLT